MFTLDLESSIVIGRPLNVVWDFMDDPQRADEWQPYLVSLEQIPPDRMGVGTEQIYHFSYLGRKFMNHYVVTVYEPQKRSGFKSLPDSAIQASGENRFEAVEGGTKLTIAFRPEIGGFFGRMPKFMVSWNYRRTLSQNLTRIKEILEGEK
ncbi:MAG: SRPBCC family protein [Anaerolineales bacterium]|nr:SRPBCC family protein [Anaerolineales bacterium]